MKEKLIFEPRHQPYLLMDIRWEEYTKPKNVNTAQHVIRRLCEKTKLFLHALNIYKCLYIYINIGVIQSRLEWYLCKDDNANP